MECSCEVGHDDDPRCAERGMCGKEKPIAERAINLLLALPPTGPIQQAWRDTANALVNEIVGS